MDKEKTVQSLIDNEATTWTEDDREFLMGQDDDKLEKFVPVVNKEKPTDNKDDKDNKDKKEVTDNKEKPTDNKDDKITDNAKPKPKPQTAEEYVAAAPEGRMREVLNQGLATLKVQKDQLIEAITSNERNTFSEESLEEKEIDELTALAHLASSADEETDPSRPPIYIGQGAAGDGGNKEEPLIRPVWNFGKQEKQTG